MSTNYLVLALPLIFYFVGKGRIFLDAPVLKVGAIIGFTLSLAMPGYDPRLGDPSRGPGFDRLPAGFSHSRGGLGLALERSHQSETGSGGAPRSGESHAYEPRKKSLSQEGSTRGAGVIFLGFLFQGVALTCMRWIHHAGLEGQRQQVLLVAGLAGGLFGWMFVLLRRSQVRRRDLVMGTGIGLFNLMALTVMFAAITELKASFFPFHGCSVVILDNLLAHFLWKEPLSRQLKAGAALGAVSMLLVL